MESADYSRASEEEREKVIAVLRRNVEQILSSKGPQSGEPELRARVEDFAARIRRGETLTGKAYRELLALLQKRWPA